MNLHSPYYKPSGIAPAAGIIVYFAAGIIAACLLAGLTCLMFVKGFILLLVVLFGFGVASGALAQIVRQFQIRAPYKILITNIMLGCLYGSSLWWIFKYYSSQTGLALFNIYSDGHATPVGSVEMQLYSTIVVMAAAGIAFIIFISVWPWIMAWKPYSETCKRWATEVNLPYTIAFVFDVKEAKKSFEAGDFSLLFNERLKAEMPYSAFTLYYVQEDPDCYYLSVVNVMKKEETSGGRETLKKKKVIKNVKITLSDFKKFQARFNPQSASS